MSSHVPYLKKEVIESEAALVLAEYGRDHGQVTAPPVPIDEIVELHLKLTLEILDLQQIFGFGDVQGASQTPIYERAFVKRGGADSVSRASRTSPSPSASVDLAHLRPLRGRFRRAPATHPLSPRPRESSSPSMLAMYEA